jgi:shikimate kinase
MDTRLKRTPGIYLTGFMGSGKTTIAQALADHLGWDFADLDAEIEAQERIPVAQIFETRGETEFRRIETEIIRRWRDRVERCVPTVIALGGGSFTQPRNLELLDNHGVKIWLDCPLETIERRIAAQADTRPLARDRETFRRLFEERRTAYGRADFRIDADCSVARAVELILALPFWK